MLLYNESMPNMYSAGLMSHLGRPAMNVPQHAKLAVYLARVDLQHELGKLVNDFSRANFLLDMQGKYHVESYSTPGLEMMHYVVTEVSAIHQQTSGCVAAALSLFGHQDVQAQLLTFT